MAVKCECCVTCRNNIICDCEDCLKNAQRAARSAAKNVAEDIAPNR